MSRVMSKVVLTVAVVCVTAVGSLAQQQTTSSETKTFEVLALNGNNLVVRLPEGTRELTVPEDFRFMVDGQSLSVRQLQVGMRGTATITTRTTVTPVTVTEVKNGTVLQAAAGTIVVKTGDEIRRFTQGDVDKRGVQIMREGKPAQVSDFREGDRLSATIITSKPPRDHDGERGAGHARPRRATAACRGSRSGATRGRAASSATGPRAASGASAATRGSANATQDRQLGAARRAHERPVARGRALPDVDAPIGRLASPFDAWAMPCANGGAHVSPFGTRGVPDRPFE